MNKKIRDLIYNFPLPLKKYIILESNPDLTDNTYAVYKTLLDNNINQKYKIFWFVDDKSKFKYVNEKNVFFVNSFGKLSFFEKIKKYYINLTAQYIIDCNKYVCKKNIKQKRLFLNHGMPYKAVPEYCAAIGPVDYLLSTAPFFENDLARLHSIDKNKIINLGFPRNDDLFCKKNMKSIFKNKKYKKIIIWLPTYRQRADKNNTFSLQSSSELGLPIIYNIETLKKLNSLLAELNILLALKPHPAQDLSLIKAENLSNFVIITNQDLEKENINLYEFLSQTDGLITDYSSVYFDYLLTKKPIAITTDDLDEYKKVFNIVYDNIFDVIKAEYINNFDEFKLFLQNVSNGNDVAKKEREEMTKIFHKYQDGNSSKRIYEFLVNKMGL